MNIYKIVDIVTGRVYIGKTQDSCKKRQTQHWSLLKKGKHHNIQLQRVYNKDPSRLIFEIVEENISDIKQLNLLEIYYIQQLGSLNMTRGGDGGDTMTNHPAKSEIYTKLKAESSFFNQGKGDRHCKYVPIPKDVQDQITELWRILLPPSIQEISKILDISRYLVRRVLIAHSITIPSRFETQKALIKAGKIKPNRRGIFTEEQKGIIVKMYVESWISCKEIGKLFGLKGESAILKVLKEREVKLRSPSEWTTYNNLKRSKNE